MFCQVICWILGLCKIGSSVQLFNTMLLTKWDFFIISVRPHTLWILPVNSILLSCFGFETKQISRSSQFSFSSFLSGTEMILQNWGISWCSLYWPHIGLLQLMIMPLFLADLPACLRNAHEVLATIVYKSYFLRNNLLNGYKVN